MKNVIGLSGVGRSGKDTFASILEIKLQQAGYSVKKVSFAGPLKLDCQAFLKDYLNIDVFTQNTEEKTLFRPMLVWYGDAQRKRTEGKYWTNLASKEIENSDADYYIVTDVRYDHYPVDELQWLKDTWKGKLCHISKYTMFRNPFPPDNRVFVEPANDHEAVNDPKIKKAADFVVEWPDISEGKPINERELLLNPTLNEYVDEFIAACNILQKSSSSSSSPYSLSSSSS
jgi:hypothetical protein